MLWQWGPSGGPGCEQLQKGCVVWGSAPLEVGVGCGAEKEEVSGLLIDQKETGKRWSGNRQLRKQTG